MSDDDKSYSRHLFWALGLLDTDEEREYNEIEDAKANERNERSNEGHSSLMDDSYDDYEWPYLNYALGLGDCPQESETSESDDMESDDGLTSDDDSELSCEENESEENDDDSDDEGNEENVNNSEEGQNDDDENEQNDDDSDDSYVFPHISKKLKKQ